MVRDLAVDVLVEVDAGRGFARERLDQALAAAPPADPRDRDLAREIVYGTLRRRSTLDHLLRGLSKHRLTSLQPSVLATLRAAAFQVLFLDRVPDSAVVNHAAGRVRRDEGPRAAGYANAVLRELARAATRKVDGDGVDDELRTVPTGDGRCVRFRNYIFEKGLDGEAMDALRWSLPNWLVRRWRERFDDGDYRRCLRAAIARPGTWLRPLPGRLDLLRAGLTEGGRTFEEVDGAFLLRGAGAVEDLPGHGEGWWVVQDPAAYEAVALLGAEKGERLLELGCGRGGKTRQLAAAGAQVVAVDRDGARLRALGESLERCGLTDRVTLVEADATDPDALPPGPFDGALVDAPCSNTGVLARRVEARWRVKKADLEPLAGLGRRLLETALRRIRPGGRVVHSVCSLEPEEGEVVVERALRRFPGAALTEARQLVPEPGRRDGGWVGRIM